MTYCRRRWQWFWQEQHTDPNQIHFLTAFHKCPDLRAYLLPHPPEVTKHTQLLECPVHLSAKRGGRLFPKPGSDPQQAERVHWPVKWSTEHCLYSKSNSFRKGRSKERHVQIGRKIRRGSEDGCGWAVPARRTALKAWWNLEMRGTQRQPVPMC